MNNTYDSEYEIQKEILKELGGTDKCYDSPFSVQLEILEKVKEGAGGGGAKIDDETISKDSTWSSQKTKEEIDNAGGLSAPFYTETFLSEEEGVPTEYLMGIHTDDEYSGSCASYLYADSDNTAAIELSSPNFYASMHTDAGSAGLGLGTETSGIYMGLSDSGDFNISANATQNDYDHYNFGVNTQSILFRYANPYGYYEAHLYPDKLEFKSRNEESGLLTYTLDSGTIEKANNALTKSLADTYYNPKNSVTASTSGYKFTKWNSNGQITGTTATAYQATEKINGTTRTIYSTSSSALPDIYAPTTAGTNGQYLRSNGSGAPTWADISIDPHIIDDASAITGDYTPAIAAFYVECITKGYQANTYIKITSYDAEGTAAESFYLPSSSRIYNGNVELWLFTTEDGNTWENIHYLITGETITRNVTTGTFGA